MPSHVPKDTLELEWYSADLAIYYCDMMNQYSYTISLGSVQLLLDGFQKVAISNLSNKHISVQSILCSTNQLSLSRVFCDKETAFLIALFTEDGLRGF